MKIFINLLSIIALVLIGINFTQINLDNVFAKESLVALSTIFSGFCAITLLQILRLAIKIKETSK